MTVRAVIWDLGGVLVRTENVYPRQELARRLGISLQNLEHLVFSGESATQAQLGAISAEQHWLNLGGMLGLSASEMQDFQTDFWGGDSLDSQLVEYIRALHKRWKTGLLSNAFTSLRRVVTEHWQFADAFDEMIISAEVGLLKPDARIYQLALQRLGVDAKESIFIDDYTENVEGAQAVMMRAIHFTSPAQVVAELETLLNGGAAWLKAS